MNQAFHIQRPYSKGGCVVWCGLTASQTKASQLNWAKLCNAILSLSILRNPAWNFGR
jgi:hypothetical protein